MRLARILSGVVAVAACVVLGGEGRAAGLLPADPWRLCAEAIAAQERSQGIPKHLLSAIALAESARKHPTFGKRMPWPWTVMAEGQGRYLPTKIAAISEVRQLQARGVRNIDVGCMQVNLHHHPDAFLTLEHAFDPHINVAYAGQFLRELFAGPGSGSWQEAAGMYHSATPELKIPYRQRVVQYWNEQQRLELAGMTAFGTGPLTAGVDPDRTTRAPIRSPAMLYSYAERRLSDPVRLPSPTRVGPAHVGPAHVGPSRVGPARVGLSGASEAPGAFAPPPSQTRLAARETGRPTRTLDEEAAFAARRAQYLQELRQAIAEVKRSAAVEVVRDDPRTSARADLR